MVSTSNKLSDSLEKWINLTENEMLSGIEGELKSQEIGSISHIRAERTIPLPPVFCLPPETLEVIFILGACDYYECEGSLCTPWVPTWVNVSYVCRHWRNVALNCPTLWTYHFNKSLRWTKELLLRSKHAPLKISICPPFHLFEEVSWPSAVLNEVLQHSERIQELCLDMSIFLPSELSLSTPLLKKLEIRLRMGDPNQFIEIADTNDLCLHALTLADCSLPWYLLNLSQLTTLSLTRVCPLSQPNMDKFLDILGSMHCLTVLDLEHSLPSASDLLSSGGLDVSLRINLPYLSLLALVAPLSTVVALLSCVGIPPTTQLSLYLLMEPGASIGDYAPISSFLEKQFSTLEQASGLTFHSLCLDTGWTPSLTFGLDCEHLSSDEDVSCNIPLKISLNGFEIEDYSPLSRSEAHCIMRDICYSLPLANVQHLHVLWPNFSLNIWEDILGRTDGLRYMKLSHGDMPDLSLLSRTAHKPEDLAGQTDQNSTPGHMVVPALEGLELHKITFARDSMSLDGGMTKESLLDALSTRAGLRDQVIMTRCY